MASPRGAEAETWTTLQLAAYLGVSPSFIQRRIRDGIISATMHGPFKWPNFRSYLITTQEVKRVPMEVPFAPPGKRWRNAYDAGVIVSIGKWGYISEMWSTESWNWRRRKKTGPCEA